MTDPGLFAALRARSIGPATAGGRITCIDVVQADPRTVYVGNSTGGVWRSTDAGTTWTPVFDDQDTACIGSVGVFQPDPNLVWVGTGEGNPRFGTGVGTGVYKSEDAGETWQWLGLERSERIHRVLTHPSDPDTVYLGVLGPQWSDGEERGVYKTTDGGRTWRRLLFTNPRSGCSDLVMDPGNPDRLLAGMYEFRRQPWLFTSGGPGSGLYLTEDAGETWVELSEEHGIRAEEKGRIGVAFSRSEPKIVYATIESSPCALYRSEDGGRSWRVVNDSEPTLCARPFYYMDIRVHPLDPERVYNFAGWIFESRDGGKSFDRITTPRTVHGDHHELWIHPDGGLMWNGTDGGVYVSVNDGETWRYIEGLPGGQFYHVAVDDEVPYNVYGGLQDGFSWKGPSEVWQHGPGDFTPLPPAIRDHDWLRIGWSDGYRAIPIPGAGGRFGYSSQEQGMLKRWDALTGEERDIKPVSPEPGLVLRTHNVPPVAVSPFEPNTVYWGAQYLFKSTDRGDNWEVISPDLTTNDPAKQVGVRRDSGATTYTTIMEIAPSPLERGLIWVGTDDGNVQLTRDEGRTWTNIAPNIAGAPSGTYVPWIEPSPHDPATAFVVLNDYSRGDWSPYLYKTTDYGRTWVSLVTPKLTEFLHTIEQDPAEPNLLFAGSEFGLYVSLDGGESWLRWRHGFPTVAVRALVVHPRDGDLVIGTFGRSVYILDDVRPLRELAAEPALRDEPLHLFSIPPRIQYWSRDPLGAAHPGDSPFQGENRPRGVLVSFWVNPDRPVERVTLRVTGMGGESIQTRVVPAQPGVNRIEWNLKYDDLAIPDGGLEGSWDGVDLEQAGFILKYARPTLATPGPDVLPGTYRVTVEAGELTSSQLVKVLADPRLDISLEERQRHLAVMFRIAGTLETAAAAIQRINEVQQALRAVAEAGGHEARVAAELLLDRLDEIRERLVSGCNSEGSVGIAYNDYPAHESVVGSSWHAPSRNQLVKVERAERRLLDSLDELNQLTASDLPPLRDHLDDQQHELLPFFDPIQPIPYRERPVE
jgi:photosystem II stability/assembly factor-like uncharacterized protein